MNWAILTLCAIGAFVSLQMQRKAAIDAAGGLPEPSVVQTPRARVFGDIPNSAIGLAYYVALGLGSFFLANPAMRFACISAAALAAAMSIYLAYSLLFVTRMPCPYCWTGHAVNWALLAMLVLWR